MTIRPIASADLPRLRELFARQGFEYEFPDLHALVGALALEDEGVIVQVVLARPTTELYFLGDSTWRNPRWRMEALTRLHEAMRRELHAKGFEDVHAWIPPEKKSFVRRLKRSFGWTESHWSSLSRSTAARTS